MIKWFMNKSYGTPTLTLYKENTAHLSVAASQMLGMNTKAILLGYDEERQIIAIKPVDISTMGRKKLSTRRESFWFSIKGFYSFYGISLTKTQRLEVKKENDMLIAELNDSIKISPKDK